MTSAPKDPADAAVVQIDALRDRKNRKNRPPSAEDGSDSTAVIALRRVVEGIRVALDANGAPHAWINGRPVPLFSAEFRAYLVAEVARTSKRLPSANLVAEYSMLAHGRALATGQRVTLHTRIAGDSSRVVVNLANSAGELVVVTAEGWRIVSRDSDPALPEFVERPTSRPAFTPQPGSTIERLRSWINVERETDFHLLLAWLMAALLPQGPYPILVIIGEQGTSKSTLARILKQLIDPTAAPLRAVPRQESDFVIAAFNSWVLVIDNVSRLPAWLADAACCVSTSGGWVTRSLYTDSVEAVYELVRPLVFTSLEEQTARQDFADRALTIRLAPIADTARRTEREFWGDFEREGPAIFGALLELLAATLRELPHARPPSLGRMADFTVVVEAVTRALELPQGSLATAYARVRADAATTGLESSLVAGALERLMAQQAFDGTTSELYERLSELAGDHMRRSREWPSAPNRLTNELNRIAPALRAAGIQTHRSRGAHGTRWRIWRASDDKSAGRV